MFETQAIEIPVAGPVATKAQEVERRRMSDWLDKRIAAGKQQYSCEVVSLTPVLAQLLLERNKHNRRVSKRNARGLASDIAAGRFIFNGASITVQKNGDLGDGQHRCEAVIETGKPITIVMVFGVEKAARYTIDTGKSKSAADMLHMKGFDYSKVHAAVMSFYLEMKSTGSLTQGGSTAPTTSQKVNAADEIAGVSESIVFTSGAMKTIRGHAQAAFCHHMFWKRSGRAAADEFISRLIDGDEIRKTSPIYYCRNRLMGQMRGDLAGARIELIIKCWNAWRLGQVSPSFRIVGGPIPKVER